MCCSLLCLGRESYLVPVCFFFASSPKGRLSCIFFQQRKTRERAFERLRFISSCSPEMDLPFFPPVPQHIKRRQQQHFSILCASITHMNVASSSSAFDTPFCAAKLLLHCSGTMVAVASRLKFQHREKKLGPLSS